MPNSTELDALRKVYRDGLLKDVVPFWTSHVVDRECGGFFTCVDGDGSAWSTDKAIWVQSRFTWLLSTLYNTVERRTEWLDLARHGIEFIRRAGFDKDGRMFWSVTRDGRPLRKRRYIFSETFAVIALSEYALATGDDSARRQAGEVYRLLLRYINTPGLLEPKLIPQTRVLKAHGIPMILLATTQILRRLGDDPLYDQVIDDAIRQVRDHFWKPEFGCLLECVGPNGEFLDEPMGREVNPGHAIETAWFLMHEAQHRNNDRELIALACRILDASLEIGWDKDFGGIYYFRDCKGKPCPQYEHDMKLWWPHNEAIYATLLAYHLTGAERYWDWHRRLHEWSYAHFPDRKHGEWFGYLHRDGTLSSTIKGNMWKGPFHLPRMQLYAWQLLDRMIAKS